MSSLSLPNNHLPFKTFADNKRIILSNIQEADNYIQIILRTSGKLTCITNNQKWVESIRKHKHQRAIKILDLWNKLFLKGHVWFNDHLYDTAFIEYLRAAHLLIHYIMTVFTVDHKEFINRNKITNALASTLFKLSICAAKEAMWPESYSFSNLCFQFNPQCGAALTIRDAAIQHLLKIKDSQRDNDAGDSRNIITKHRAYIKKGREEIKDAFHNIVHAPEYIELFISHGFDDLATVCAVTNDDLKEMNVSLPGTRKKILCIIQEIITYLDTQPNNDPNKPKINEHAS